MNDTSPSVTAGLFFVRFTVRWSMRVAASGWQAKHSESSACARPTWPPVSPPSVVPVPVAQLMPSWHAPQARRLGSENAWLALVASAGSWQTVHMRWPLSSIEKFKRSNGTFA